MTERGRRTLREQMLRNQQTEALYAALSGRPARELPIPPEPKRRPKREPSPAEQRQPGRHLHFKSTVLHTSAPHSCTR